MQAERSSLTIILLLALAGAAASASFACTKSESGTSGTASTGSTASTSSTPTPSASTTASATPSATAADTTTAAVAAPDAAAAATTAKVDPTKKDGGGAATSASAGPVECGVKPLPDCPLQAWMKANTNPPVLSGDLPALAAALEKSIAFAPPGYTNWVSIAKDGAAAAKGGDLTAAKASCRTCHDQYKEKYKKEMRARKI